MLRTTNQSGTAKTVDFSGKSVGRIASAAWLKTRPNGSSQRGFDKALRTVAVLQTTLELEQLAKLFSREVSASVPHSSIHFSNDEPEIDLTVGRTAKHTCTFRLIVEKQSLGQVTFTRGKSFTEKEDAMLEFLLSSLAYPLRNALQYENAFQASLTDPLTGIYNRTAMEAALHREISLARRHRTPLSLIIMDIDGLKQINDKYGHATGDQLIKDVVEAVCGSLRETDLVSRYGGDEFTILLNNTARRGAAILAENIRKQIQSVACQFDDKTIKVTVSMGVASLTRRDKYSGLFARADQALYDAKRQGRNCIKVAGATK
ncbi:MAG: GGDEF domain-containing protein [Acidiferrobacterales bacterium]